MDSGLDAGSLFGGQAAAALRQLKERHCYVRPMAQDWEVCHALPPPAPRHANRQPPGRA
jgi:hypothetical protein